MRIEVLRVIESMITESEICGKQVLEAGARNVNGSVRPFVEAYHPKSYIGIDIEEGSGVDRICDIYDLISVFGEEKFDVVICTETLEHVANWILAISNLKKVLRPGGIMVLSAPRPGRKYHGYPFDFWRYAKEDWRVILSDMIYLSICGIKRGMVVKAIKPLDYEEAELGMYKLYSVIHQKRRTYVP